LPGLTTTPKSRREEKIKELNKLKITEIALFPTAIALAERKILYESLKNSPVQRIPHVHLRDDMEEWELEYLIDKYQTKAFNIHADERGLKFLNANGKYKKIIYLENQGQIDSIFIDNLPKCGGICLDATHWEDQGVIQNNIGYEKFAALLKNNKIGCSHISAIKTEPIISKNYVTSKKMICYSNHYLDDLSQLDYVKKYTAYLPNLISIELENTFAEQLKVKKYFENLIKI